MPAIVARDLTRIFRSYRKRPGFWGGVAGLFRREYDRIEAAVGVNFEIDEGELVGFLGPNGAGKTTTLKMLAGLLHPTSGEARVLGHVPWERRNEYRRRFALVMGQKNQLWWDLPALESFELNREIYQVERREFQARLDELTDLLDVRDKLRVMVRELSLGERMKMELIASLLHAPSVLFLDEPTIGLDVVSQQKVRDFIRHYNATRQVTIILTSHYMQDIEALCPRVIIIDKGRIFFDGRLSEIVARFAPYKLVQVACRQPIPDDALRPLGEIAERRDSTVRLRVARDRVGNACRELFARFPIEDVSIEEIPVEDIVREIFGQTRR
jgi:ABC-2 type transport system ATP-binding protein